VLVGTDGARSRAEARRALARPEGAAGRVPELWDGHAADRIAQAVLSRIA
jgi:hypothetical protein